MVPHPSFCGDKMNETCNKCGADRVSGKPCSPCRKEYMASYYAAYREDKWRSPERKAKNKVYSARRRVEHPEKLRAWNAAWKAANKEKVAGYSRIYIRKYYEANKLRIADSVSAWRAKNPEKVREIRKRWKQSNPEYVRASTYAWRKANPEKVLVMNERRRALIKGARGTHTYKEWKAVKDSFGNRCAYCRVGGKMHKDHRVPYARGGTNFAFNLQPLCQHCNQVKHAKVFPGLQHSLFDRQELMSA